MGTICPHIKIIYMIGIYHNADLDGFASGALIKHLYPQAKMYGYNYGMNLDMYTFINEEIIMADISFPIEKMIELKKSNNEIVWIDHHISAINRYNEYVEKTINQLCVPVLKDGVAACELTWEYLFPNTATPRAIMLLSDYDTWQNKNENRWNNNILPFQYGMRNICNSVETFPIEVLYNDKLVDDIINNGKIILEYQRKVNELQVSKSAFESDFYGYKAICINLGGVGSTVFDSIYDDNKHDIKLTFQYDGSKWCFSLYTTKDDIDCSQIAKNLGGGGHKQAAGFEIDDLSKIFTNKK